jgi:hypothetical protein
MRLLRTEVHEDGRYGPEAEAPSSDEALVAADDYVVIVPGDDRLEEAELAERAGKRIELGSADLAGVGGVGVQVVDRKRGRSAGPLSLPFALLVPSEGTKMDARLRAKRPHSDGFSASILCVRVSLLANVR